MACNRHLAALVAPLAALVATSAALAPAAADGPSAGPADGKPAAPVVALLPLSTQDRERSIYSKPVADAVAGHLRARFAGAGTPIIESVSLADAVPSHVAMVIDGRIVERSSGRILLEAQLRDPHSGTRLVVIASRAAPITRIDELAVELADRLAVAIGHELARLARSRHRRANPTPGEPAAAAGTRDPDSDRATGSPAADSDRPAAPPRDGRPPMVVFDAIGQAAGGNVPVGAVATDAGYQLARALGFRPVAHRERGIVPPDRALPVLRRVGARYALMISVYDIDFAWYGVLGARGKVRYALLDAERGYFVYNQVHRTDTLVGNRGDRHGALVRYVLDQSRDIARPPLGRVLQRIRDRDRDRDRDRGPDPDRENRQDRQDRERTAGEAVK